MGKYLTVDEQSTYIDVTCDGYVFRIVTSAWDTDIFNVRNVANDTELISMSPYWSDGTVYNFGYDSARSTEIIENTPTRVKIRVVGSLSSTNGDTDTYLTNLPSGSIKYEFTFYSDRYTVSTEWKPTGAISYTDNSVLIAEGAETAFTNEDHFYENSGVESAASTYTVYNSADYLCFTSDEMNAQCTLLDQSGWSFDQRSGGVCDFVYRDTSALAAGTYTGTILVIIDSAQREKSSLHTDVLLAESLSDVDNLATGLTKVGSPTNSEGGLEVTDTNYVSMATAGLLDISQGTIEFEFKSNAAYNDGADHMLLGSRGSGNDAGDFYIWKDSSWDALWFVIVDSSGTAHYVIFNDSDWYSGWTSLNHYRFVWNSSAAVEGSYFLYAYKNDVALTLNSGSGHTASWTDATLNSTIGIGNDYEDTTRDMDGIMKNLFISDVPHDKKFSSVERLQLGDQYKDTSMPTAVGHVTDRIIPANIGSYGFCSDGAWHLDASTKNRGRVEPDITRLDPVWEYENWNIRTGDLDSFEDHLVGHWTCDDNAASTTILDALGNANGTLVGGNNTEDLDSTDATRGTSLLLDGSADYLNLSSAIAQLSDVDRLTIQITFKPQFAYNVGSDQGIFSLYYDGNNFMNCYYLSSPDYFRFYPGVFNGSGNAFDTSAYTSNNDLQQYHTIQLMIDNTNDIQAVVWNGEVVHVANITNTWSFDPTSFTVGYDSYGTNYSNIIVDEVKLYNGCLLPYGGGPMTGNGAVNTSVAHDEILFHVDFEGATDTIRRTDKISSIVGTNNGSGQIISGAALVDSYGYDTNGGLGDLSFTNTDRNIFDERTGQISFWVNIQATPSYKYIFGAGYDADNRMAIRINGTTLDLQLHSDGTNDSDGDIGTSLGTGIWQHMKLCWDQNELEWQFYLNGTLSDTGTFTSKWTEIPSTVYIGSDYNGANNVDAYFDQVTITSNPNTPDRWSVFGKPVYMPMIKKNGIYQQYGADMNAVITGGSALITNLGEVS